MMNKMAKKYMIERFLNHTLEIIYFLTGEEYIMVKKNSLDHSIHQLTGEIPIKFGDVSVYFTMEEWEYIEGHKEIYQDMMKENHQNLSNKKLLETKEPGFHDENLDDVVASNGESAIEETSVPQVDIYSDSRADLRNDKPDTISISEEEEEVGENDLEVVEVDLNTNAKITTSVSPVSDFHGGGHDSCWQFFRPEAGLDHEKLDIISVSGEEEEEMDRRIIQQAEIDPETCAGEFNAEIESQVEEIEEPGEMSQLEDTEQEIQEEISRDGPMNRDEDPHPGASPSAEFVEDEASKSSAFHGGNAVGVSPTELTSYEGMPLMSTAESYQCEQQTLHLNENFVSGSDHREKKRQVKKKNSRNRIKRFTRNPVYSCNKCGKQFDYKSHLVMHVRTHTEDTLLKCNDCEKQFVDQSHLTKHQRTHKGEKPHRCDQCGKHFTYKSQFTMHLRIHTGEKPHSCNECGKNFAYKSYLIIHQRIHTGEKPHVCSHCGRCFTDKSNLRKHENTHAEDKPYSCLKCGKKFHARYNFTAHLRIHITEKAVE